MATATETPKETVVETESKARLHPSLKPIKSVDDITIGCHLRIVVYNLWLSKTGELEYYIAGPRGSTCTDTVWGEVLAIETLKTIQHSIEPMDAVIVTLKVVREFTKARRFTSEMNVFQGDKGLAVTKGDNIPFFIPNKADLLKYVQIWNRSDES